MQKHVCHFCEEFVGIIILPDGNRLCPKCMKNLYPPERMLPQILRNQLREIVQINAYDPIGKQNAELACFFIKNGMTISNVARQMGITRATIYAWLRKYKLRIPNEDDKE